MPLSERRDWPDLRNQFEPEVCRIYRLIAFELRANGLRWCGGTAGSHSETSFGTTGDLALQVQRRTLLYWLRLFCGVEEDLYEIALSKLLDCLELTSYRDVELWEASHEWKDVAALLILLGFRRLYPNQHKEV